MAEWEKGAEFLGVDDAVFFVDDRVFEEAEDVRHQLALGAAGVDIVQPAQKARAAEGNEEEGAEAELLPHFACALHAGDQPDGGEDEEENPGRSGGGEGS